jgi:apolipoprotein N-acyltransferase
MAPQGAEVVLLPEACVTLRPEWAADVRALFAGVARRNHVQLVIGFDEYLADGTHRNVAEVISQSGTFAGRYIKQRHLPGQDYQAGKEILVLPGGVGVSICKDLDFPSLGRRYALAGTGLMMVPAWDFGKDARLHAQMAWLRGVEGGYSVVRCAEEGLLSVTDSKGIPVAISESMSESGALLAASVRYGPGDTIYARTGDVFAVACILVSAALVGFGLFRRTRRVFEPRG